MDIPGCQKYALIYIQMVKRWNRQEKTVFTSIPRIFSSSLSCKTVVVVVIIIIIIA